ncbi:response regulator transcription factor [Corynebacterium durum]|uniref:response regulator transcription factor n=1 Tax=Corynebacterium durum TaxID=61592 RepID=UPI0028E9B3AA|nr:response regulator transcription factor [Corynebacterium durum]
MTKISVGLVDDQPLVRTGFAMLINSQDDMETSWEASDGVEVPTQTHADIVLMDVQMPKVNGIEATRALLRSDADTKVIMLTTFDDQDFVSGAIEAGASGFLLKDAQPEELLHAIRLVYAGQAVLAPKATARVLGMLKNQGVDKHVEPPDQGVLDELTPREHEVLRLIALGLSNEEIAVAEYVSMATVKTHVRHILMKTNSRDRVQAVLCAYRNGLVTTEELLRHPLD